MRSACAAFMVVFALAHAATAQARRTPYGLPAGALVLEARALDLGGASDRALVLWMLRPSRNPRDPGETYTCPDETRGSYYRGPARVSLVDTRAGRVINTLKIVEEDADGEDEMDIPYRIHAGRYYHVAGVPPGREGRPTILWLRDLNGDGKALEFALYDAVACMGLETTLFGYSEKQDRVIQYPVSLEEDDGAQRKTQVLYWVDYLFSRKQTAPGFWKYEIDYRGRGGSLDRYEVRYNIQAERFEGTFASTPGQ